MPGTADAAAMKLKELTDQVQRLMTGSMLQMFINILVLIVIIYFIYKYLTKEGATDGAGTQFTGNGYYPQGTLLSDVNPNATTVSALSGAALAAPWPSYNIDGFEGSAYGSNITAPGYNSGRTNVGAANITEQLLTNMVASSAYPQPPKMAEQYNAPNYLS